MVMRKLELHLNQMQKVRFERALERLQTLSSMSNSVIVTTDSVLVDHEDALLKGHGTSEVDGELLATVCGVVVRVEKLVYVNTMYKPQVNDIVVGRVIEVDESHCRVELNSYKDGVLNLSSMAIDDVNILNVFSVVCAEVVKLNTDGSLQLRIRSHKKLGNGELLMVDPYLVKRSNNHCHFIESLGIDLILGCNGFIWIGEPIQVQDPMIVDDDWIISASTKKTRLNILRIRNAIQVLSNLGFTVTLQVIMETFNISNMKNIDVYDMLGAEFHVLVAENEAERRRLA